MMFPKFRVSLTCLALATMTYGSLEAVSELRSYTAPDVTGWSMQDIQKEIVRIGKDQTGWVPAHFQYERQRYLTALFAEEVNRAYAKLPKDSDEDINLFGQSPTTEITTYTSPGCDR